MAYCASCGGAVDYRAMRCVHCGATVVSPAAASEANGGLRFILPVGRSGWAIASGYLALFSVLLVFAPLALITGILALRDIRRHPAKLGRGRAWLGIIVGGLFTVLGIFGAVATCLG